MTCHLQICKCSQLIRVRFVQTSGGEDRDFKEVEEKEGELFLLNICLVQKRGEDEREEILLKTSYKPLYMYELKY